MPLSAASAATPAAKVSNLKATPALLSYRGGAVRFTAKVAHATRCTFRVTPKVRGLPATVNCGGATAARTVKFPQNQTDTRTIYRLSVTSGKSIARTTVSLAAAPASIMSFISTPASVSSAGGPVVLQGRVSRATSCSFGAVPTLAGLPTTVPCVGGEGSQDVRIPSTTSGTALSYKFYLTANGPGGSSLQSMIRVAEAPVFTFSSPNFIDSPQNSPTSVSCPTAGFCELVDSVGNAFMFDGTSWTGQAIDTGISLNSVSCTSNTFCVAVDSNGNTLTYNGTGWTDPHAIGLSTDLLSVSCSSATFCMAVDAGGNAFTFDGSNWTEESTGYATGNIVTCASATFCVSAEGGGVALYNGVGWSVLEGIDDYTIDSVSCPTVTFCKAVDSEGNAVTFDGMSWSSPANIDGNGLVSLSCPTSTFCAAIDSSDALTYNGSSWTGPFSIEPYGAQLVGVSCPTDSFCVAIDSGGDVLVGRST
jgi:hypothetical protein